jgi:peptide/nickel transport system substrate-binding protein
MTGAQYYRWQNAEYDKYVEIMGRTTADTQEFQDAARSALEIWLENLPTIPIMQQYLLTPFNSTYWTNWPDSTNNYIHPGHWWYTCNIMIHNVHAVG